MQINKVFVSWVLFSFFIDLIIWRHLETFADPSKLNFNRWLTLMLSFIFFAFILSGFNFDMSLFVRQTSLCNAYSWTPSSSIDHTRVCCIIKWKYVAPWTIFQRNFFIFLFRNLAFFKCNFLSSKLVSNFKFLTFHVVFFYSFDQYFVSQLFFVAIFSILGFLLLIEKTVQRAFLYLYTVHL